jgi:hypothetical protein
VHRPPHGRDCQLQIASDHWNLTWIGSCLFCAIVQQICLDLVISEVDGSFVATCHIFCVLEMSHHWIMRVTSKIMAADKLSASSTVLLHFPHGHAETLRIRTARAETNPVRKLANGTTARSGNGTQLKMVRILTVAQRATIMALARAVQLLSLLHGPCN